MHSKTRRDTIKRRQSKRVQLRISAALLVLAPITLIIVIHLLRLAKFTFIPLLDLTGVFLTSGLVAWLLLPVIAPKVHAIPFTKQTHRLRAVVVCGIWGTWLFLVLNWQLAARQPLLATTPVMEAWL